MSEDTDDTGRLKAYKNKDHEPGGKQPAFKGTITSEGSQEQRQVVLWARKSRKTGKTFFIGKAGETAAEQIDKLTDAAPAESQEADDTEQLVKPNEIKLWPNQSKELGSKQIDYYGHYNPGEGTKMQRLDVWANNDRYGKPMLSGNVTEQKPKKEQELKQEAPKPAKKKQRAMGI